MIEPRLDFDSLSDDELLSAWQLQTRHIKHLTEEQGHVEMLLRQRLLERGATEIPHPSLTVKLESRFGGYDLSRIQVLKELLPPDVIAEAYTPAHEETIQVPDKWDGRKLLGWPKRFGKEVAAVLEAAELPRAVRLVIQPKKTTPTVKSDAKGEA